MLTELVFISIWLGEISSRIPPLSAPAAHELSGTTLSRSIGREGSTGWAGSDKMGPLWNFLNQEDHFVQVLSCFTWNRARQLVEQGRTIFRIPTR